MDVRAQKLAQLAKEVELATESLAERRVDEYAAKRAVENSQRILADRLRKLTDYALLETEVTK